MLINKPIQQLLQQLQNMAEVIDDNQYTTPIPAFSNASIGHHLRHIVEFFTTLMEGYESGIINYDGRERNHRIETDRTFALQQLTMIKEGIERPDKPLTLVASFPKADIREASFSTNYSRELLYNLEHTVHHMAFIRMGIEALTPIQLPEQFGVAESTLQYRQSCAR